MCRYIYDWNIVVCDVTQPIHLTSRKSAKSARRTKNKRRSMLRDWILLVCFSWRCEATEVPRVNFVMREALFEIYTWIQFNSIRIQSLYLYFNYFIKIVPFWLRNIRFLIQNTRSLFYGCHYSPLQIAKDSNGSNTIKQLNDMISAIETSFCSIKLENCSEWRTRNTRLIWEASYLIL